MERRGLDLERRAIDMWMDPWLLDAMFFERMADARRAAESRRLFRLAEPERVRVPGRGSWTDRCPSRSRGG